MGEVGLSQTAATEVETKANKMVRIDRMRPLALIVEQKHHAWMGRKKKYLYTL